MTESVLQNLHSRGYSEQFIRGRLEDLTTGRIKSLDVGWQCLSACKWLIGGSVSLICARPGVGKTWFVHDLSRRATEQGYKVANIQLEEDMDYHISRIVESSTGVNLTNPDSPTDKQLVIENRGLIDKLSTILRIPGYGQGTLYHISEIIAEEAKKGADLIIVDSVSVAEKSQRSWEDDQRFVNVVKEVAKNHKTRVVLVTHPKSMNGKNADLDSMAGGAAYQRLCQCVLWLGVNDKPRGVYTDHSFNADLTDGNRTVVVLKARNSGPEMKSNKILFEFNHGKFKEKGFFDD